MPATPGGSGLPPWMLAAQMVLQHHFPNTHPALAFVGAVHALPPGPLSRLATALARVGITQTAVLASDPGEWCADQPLWCSPAMALEQPFLRRPAPYQALMLAHEQSRPAGASPAEGVGAVSACLGLHALRLLPEVRVVGDLVALVRRVNAGPQLTLQRQLARHGQPQQLGMGDVAQRWANQRHLDAMMLKQQEQQQQRQPGRLVAEWGNSDADRAALLEALWPHPSGDARRPSDFPDGLHTWLMVAPTAVQEILQLWQAVPPAWRIAAAAALGRGQQAASGRALTDAQFNLAAQRALGSGLWQPVPPLPAEACAAAVLGVAMPAPVPGPEELGMVLAPAGVPVLNLPPAPPLGPAAGVAEAGLLLGSALSVRACTAVLASPGASVARMRCAGTVRSALLLAVRDRPVTVGLRLAAAGGVGPAAGEIRVHLQLQPMGEGLGMLGEVTAALEQLLARLDMVWRLPWENSWKEVWWRLLLHGVAGAGGHDVGCRGPCPCGWVPAAALAMPAVALLQRDHAFWDCPVTGGVRQLLQRHLPAGVVLHPQHLWLLVPPHPSVHHGVWVVVGLAALTALNRARRFMWSMELDKRRGAAPPGRGAGAAGGGRQLTLHQAWGLQEAVAPRPLTVVQCAERDAVVRMLAGVRDFVDIGFVPAAWRGAEGLGPSHPFLGFRSDLEPAGLRHRLVLNMRLDPAVG